MTWTPLVFVYPKRHIDNCETIRRLNFDRWSEDFEWRQDPYNGWLDVAQDPRETLQSRRGDCEDYALLAASWAYSRRRNPSLAFCFPKGSPIPRHVVAADDHRVYSSGDIYENTTLDEYIEQSEYNWYIERQI